MNYEYTTLSNVLIQDCGKVVWKGDADFCTSTSLFHGNDIQEVLHSGLWINFGESHC